MRPRSLAVFAAVVLALGAFVWFYERELPDTAAREEQAKRVFGALESDDVREVTLVEGGRQVQLVREAPVEADGDEGEDGEDGMDFTPAAEWRLVAPLAARADRFAVEGLLSALLGIEKGRTLEAIDRAQYGLQPPAAAVTLVDDEGTTRTLEVGREIPGTDQRVVALAGGGEGWAVAGTFWSQLTKEPAEWRSRELFPGTRDEVERISLRRPAANAAAGERSLLLARRGDDWWVESPLTDLADRDRVEELLTALTGLLAEEFVPALPADAGVEPPAATLEVVRRGRSEPFRVVLGAPAGPAPAAVGAEPATEPAPGEGGDQEPARYALVGGQAVTVRTPALDEALARPDAQWRSTAWTSFAVYEVDRLEVTDAAGKLVLVRDEADWKRSIGDADGVKIFYSTVSDLLAALADARAERVLAPEQARAEGIGQGAAVLTVRLVGEEGKREQTLTLHAGPPPAGRISGRQAVLALPAALPADLAAKLAAVRAAEPLAAAAPDDDQGAPPS